MAALLHHWHLGKDAVFLVQGRHLSMQSASADSSVQLEAESTQIVEAATFGDFIGLGLATGRQPPDSGPAQPCHCGSVTASWL